MVKSNYAIPDRSFLVEGDNLKVYGAKNTPGPKVKNKPIRSFGCNSKITDFTNEK